MSASHHSPAPARRTCASVQIGETRVGTDIARRRLAPCSIHACRGQCCRFGAVVELSQAREIDALLPRLLPLIRPEARRLVGRLGWSFKGTVKERYASGETLQTASRVVRDRCVFVMDQEAGGCALHALALQDGVEITRYKPRECVLFPLNGLREGELHVHTWAGYPCTEESEHHAAALHTLQDELSLALGSEGYLALRETLEALEREGIFFEPELPPDPPPVARGRPPSKR